MALFLLRGGRPDFSIDSRRRAIEVRGISHLAKNERDAPNFLHEALDNAACAPFF